MILLAQETKTLGTARIIVESFEILGLLRRNWDSDSGDSFGVSSKLFSVLKKGFLAVKL